MMFKNRPLLVILAFAILFTILFYKESLGLNLLLFEGGLLIWLSVAGDLRLKGMNTIMLTASVVLTLIFTVIHHSVWSYFINFLMLFTLIGHLSAPHLRSVLNSFRMAGINLFIAQWSFFKQLLGAKEGKPARNFGWRRMRIFWLPLLIVIGFVIIYSLANPGFGRLVDRVIGKIENSFTWLFQYVEVDIIMIFIVGMLLSSFFLIRSRVKTIAEEDDKASDVLIRERTPRYNHSNLGLKNEFRSALFLFGALNVILLILNIIDIDSVWIRFEWEGQYLKEFVHVGTYLLIFAILISILLVLYFFRRNLNFYRQNKWLKRLCYAWLAQNVFLTLSVGLRNLYYIDHFALAYKRIAVIFFLALTVFGLVTVYLKVREKKSLFYLIRVNLFTWFVVLSLSTCFNWDRIIARYNFGNADHSFVHLNFMAGLSNSALPELDKSKKELESMRFDQETKFSFSSSGSFRLYSKIYMNSDEYYRLIQNRKKYFKSAWERKGWLSWNWAEYKAYQYLSAEK